MLTRVAVCSLALLAFASVIAQETLSKESYITPARAIAEAVLAPWYKNRSVSNLSPNRKRYVSFSRNGLPKLADLARPYANLGGVQIDTEAMRQRSLTTRSADGLSIVTLGDGEVSVTLPAGAKVSDAVWSPDSSKVAFFLHQPNGTDVWIADADNGHARGLRVRALPTLSSTLAWTADSRRLVTVLNPGNRKPPANAPVASTPQVQMSDDKPTRLRTYAGLMRTPLDQELLEYYGTGQLALIDVATGAATPIGKPAMIEAFDPKPDGTFFRVTLMEKPFSYVLPASSFPEREVIWDSEGKEKLQIRKRTLTGDPAANQPKPNDKRAFSWRPDGAGLVYLQSEGTGDKAKDRLVFWKPPFGEKDSQVLYETTGRLISVRFGSDPKTLFVTQTVDGKARLSSVRPGGNSVTLAETKPDDDPVDLVTKDGPQTGSVVRMSSDGNYAYLSGTAYPEDNLKDAPKPFLEKVDLTSGKREKLWESKSDVFEQASILEDDASRMLITRQSPSMVPQTFLVSSGKETQLTANQDYLPDLTQAQRETLVVTRPDGIKFRVKVTLPRYFIPYGRMPAFFWFYPSEFQNQAEYDKSVRRTNKNLFNSMSPSNKAIMLRAGYVLVEPDCPIIGPSARKNDAYLPQLRNNLAAVIDALDKKGYIDRTRLAIGGHSYGAFSTANAMVHTPFFRAGIAGDGNYNRSLTPFGFQSDDRQIWEARETYIQMSPILWVDQITGALLMYHGIDDQNMGTDPINSQRMFAALEDLGKPAALYMYPYEDHGQIAEETILDQWARWIAWLDKWVKPQP